MEWEKPPAGLDAILAPDMPGEYGTVGREGVANTCPPLAVGETGPRYGDAVGEAGPRYGEA